MTREKAYYLRVMPREGTITTYYTYVHISGSMEIPRGLSSTT